MKRQGPPLLTAISAGPGSRQQAWASHPEGAACLAAWGCGG